MVHSTINLLSKCKSVSHYFIVLWLQIIFLSFLQQMLFSLSSNYHCASNVALLFVRMWSVTKQDVDNDTFSINFIIVFFFFSV